MSLQNREELMMEEFLLKNGYTSYVLDGQLIVKKDGNTATDAQLAEYYSLVESYVPPAPSLTPRQFKRFFLLANLDLFVDQNLPALRAINAELYADVVSQLEGGTEFYWHLTEQFMRQLLQIVPNAPAVDFDKLRQLWIMQSDHHIAV
jgi:hypothetical protein